MSIVCVCVCFPFVLLLVLVLPFNMHFVYLTHTHTHNFFIFCFTFHITLFIQCESICLIEKKRSETNWVRRHGKVLHDIWSDCMTFSIFYENFGCVADDFTLPAQCMSRWNRQWKVIIAFDMRCMRTFVKGVQDFQHPNNNCIVNRTGCVM